MSSLFIDWYWNKTCESWQHSQ